MKESEKPYFKYVADVLSGRIVAGGLIRKACARFDCLLDKYDFRSDRVDNVIRLFSFLRHFKGRHSGRPFLLEPWQAWIVASIYGFYKDDGTRLVNTAYIEVARKNGKTALAAGIGLNALINDNEDGAEVYFAANSRDQVKISAWPLCSSFSKSFDPKGKYLKVFRDTVKYDRKQSWMKVLAADSTKLDGPNPSTFILDEYHAAKTNSLKAVLESGQGMRENPLELIITTAGFDKSGPCYDLRSTAIDILDGNKEDDSFFIAIYGLDESDDWKNPACWAKANPNLGVTVRDNYLKKEILKAINTPSDEVNVKTKNLNMWCDTSVTWIPDERVRLSLESIHIENFFGMDCWVGIDLAAVSDLAAVTFLFRKDGVFHAMTKYYLPEDALNTKENKQLYGEWHRNGYLTLTQGNVIDYDYILNDIMEVDKVCYVNKVGYDAWNSTQFVINATDKGLPMEPVSQSIGNFNRPTKELERVILSDRIKIDSNPINRFCFANVVMKVDYNGNMKPSKASQKNKIDGVISLIMAYGVYLTSPQYESCI